MRGDTKTSQNLGQGWEFRSVDKKWLSASVPGNIHLDLMNHELIPDPFIGSNESELQWISDKDWTYRLFFKPNKGIIGKKNKGICFYGIDTYADVFLNDKKIISSNNMFHPWVANINNILTTDINELVIVPVSYTHLTLPTTPYV